MSTLPINVTAYGATGDGVTDDYVAIQWALSAAAAANAAVYVPAGVYRMSATPTLTNSSSKVSIFGDGANVSVLLADGCNGLDLSFAQQGIQQPYGVNIRDITLRARNSAGTGLTVSYGNPPVTNDHLRPSVSLRGVNIESDNEGSWANGIVLESAWNISMTDVFVSGNACGGNWNAMGGEGIRLAGVCVNAHFTNVKTCFFSTGFYYHAGEGVNAEGMFFSNCSMVAVKRGVWITGNPGAAAPRMSTFTWVGGMIECRVGGVYGGSAAFHLVNVWTALIHGAQLITETLDSAEWTYALFLNNCSGVVVAGCDINAWHYGVYTQGDCKAINVNGNTYTNTPTQVVFDSGTTESRSYGAVRFNNGLNEQDWAGGNKLGWV